MPIKFSTILFIIALLLNLNMPTANAMQLNQHPDIQNYLNNLSSTYHFNRQALTSLYHHVHINKAVIKRMNTPYEAKPWHTYRDFFITQHRIRKGVKFWKQHKQVLNKAYIKYGVPPKIIVGILGIETYYGLYLDQKRHHNLYRTIDALTTLAFDYPKRAPFFRNELTEFLLLTREEHLRPLALTGSYAGALGLPQFMPSSYRHYAIAFNKTFKPDLIHNPNDAIISIANYLHYFGWKRNAPVTVHIYSKNLHNKGLIYNFPKRPGINDFWLLLHNFQVIMAYNPRENYAMAVYQLAEAVSKSMHHHA